VLALSTIAASQTVSIPQGMPIMLDGKLTAGEWSDAKQLNAGDFARLYFKQNNNDLLIAIQFLKSKTGTTDLYLSPGDEKIYDLHASAKLGERTLNKGKWPEEWSWWNNDHWVANVSRPDDWNKRTFKDEDVREYQISRDRFPGKEWKIFLELMTPAEPEWQTIPFPSGADSRSDQNWLVLKVK
jgi:hypothetical protein